MAFSEDTEVRNVHGISRPELQSIADFLQGAVYCWCKNRPEEWFALRDLMGGDNTYWQGTPLMPLYDKNSPSPDAYDLAGRDAGWLLKSVIANDSRVFDTKKAELVRHYRWVRPSSGT